MPEILANLKRLILKIYKKNAPCWEKPWQGAFFVMQLVLVQLHHQLCAVMDAVDECLLLICRAEAAA